VGLIEARLPAQARMARAGALQGLERAAGSSHFIDGSRAVTPTVRAGRGTETPADDTVGLFHDDRANG
jgi:hypothetical protein